MAIYAKGRDPRTGESKWQIVVHWRGLRRDRRFLGSREQARTRERELEDELKMEHDRATGKLAPEVHVPSFLDFCAAANPDLGIPEDGRYRRYLQNPKRFTDRTRTNREYTLATLAESFGQFRLDEIKPAMVIDYQEMRADDSEASTINGEVKVLRSVLNFATSIGMTGIDSLSKKTVPDLPESKKLAEAWTEAEMKKLLDCAWTISHRMWGLVLLLANTGMRRGEALNLQWNGEWSTVDLDNKMITLRPSRWWRPKNKAGRKIPIDGVLLEYLQANYGRYPFVVTNRNGERYSYWPQRLFDEARSTAGLRGGPHRLRHTYASHFLASVPDMFLLAEVLGHEHARVTKLYTHLLPTHLERARGAVNFGAESKESQARAQWATPRGRRPRKAPPVRTPLSPTPSDPADKDPDKDQLAAAIRNGR